MAVPSIRPLTAAIGLLLFVLAAPAVGQAAGTKLASIKGSVWVRAPGAQEVRVTRNTTIAVGTRIRTGAASSAELKFPNGSLLRLRANSSMSISGNKRTKRKKSSVILFFGRLWNKVAPSKSGRSFEVATANAVCGVRGTEFETAVADDGSLRVHVTEGQVAVGERDSEAPVNAGQQIQGDERGMGTPGTAPTEQEWDTWQRDKANRMKKNGRAVVDGIKKRIEVRKMRIEELRSRQKAIESKRKAAEARARTGERGALDEIRNYNQELATIADAIADAGDEAESQFGLVDHYADLAQDPRFGMVDRKYIIAEAESLRRVKKMLDVMVAEGTDISIESMNKMLDDMSGGKSTLREGGGSSMDDLFGKDDDMFK